MRLSILAGLLVLLFGFLPGQSFIGLNAGPAVFQTADAQLYVYPKNEDWIALSLSGGYSRNAPTLFAREEQDCLEDLRSGGWHLRLGLRNDLTTDNTRNHLFWELLATYTRHQESATVFTCPEATNGRLPFENIANVWGGAVRVGYTWNPLQDRSIYQKFLIDFGMQVGAPLYSNQPLVAERNHYSGLGITWLPIRSVTLEPMIVFRWKLYQRRYGYSKGKEKQRFLKR